MIIIIIIIIIIIMMVTSCDVRALMRIEPRDMALMGPHEGIQVYAARGQRSRGGKDTKWLTKRAL
jgi:hypothetical protein